MGKALKLTTALSLLWNIYLVVGVITNSTYALTRAAGGQFETFPNAIRAAYVFTLIVVLYQALILLGNYQAPRWALTALTILSVVSVAVNLASRSANERWNAIPATVILIALYRRRKL